MSSYFFVFLRLPSPGPAPPCLQALCPLRPLPAPGDPRPAGSNTFQVIPAHDDWWQEGTTCSQKHYAQASSLTRPARMKYIMSPWSIEKCKEDIRKQQKKQKQWNELLTNCPQSTHTRPPHTGCTASLQAKRPGPSGMRMRESMRISQKASQNDSRKKTLKTDSHKHCDLQYLSPKALHLEHNSNLDESMILSLDNLSYLFDEALGASSKDLAGEDLNHEMSLFSSVQHVQRLASLSSTQSGTFLAPTIRDQGPLGPHRSTRPFNQSKRRSLGRSPASVANGKAKGIEDFAPCEHSYRSSIPWTGEVRV